ncbi:MULTISPECIES: PRC-barrel domain-containing protein [unclassified Methanopyrus]|uniref:PRC-barrel domain-containing protein n=1 Tax=Methanopyrus sp. SNP6 TaxID=1937005 RepID=UPI0011E5F8CC|nr:PRC-barrel domain-containing protein [Methanopyrus sp. SNP6]
MPERGAGPGASGAKNEMRVSELLQRHVITNRGHDLGIVMEVELAWKDKCIKALLVQPSKEYAQQVKADVVEVPWSSVLAVGKYVLVDESKIRPRR